MDDAKLIDSSISIDDLFENIDCLFFGDCFPHLDHFGKVAPIAELGDDAGM